MKSVSAEDHPDFPSIKWSRLELEWIRERDRQWKEQLAAALAACEAKDEALELHGKQYPHMVKGYCLDALALQPDASALTAYRNQVIEECAKHLEHLEYMYAALTIRELKR